MYLHWLGYSPAEEHSDCFQVLLLTKEGAMNKTDTHTHIFLLTSMIQTHFFPKDLSSLFWKKEGKIKGERMRQYSIHGFTPQMATSTEAGPGHSWEPGASSSSPMWVQGPKYLDHLSLLAQAH